MKRKLAKASESTLRAREKEDEYESDEAVHVEEESSEDEDSDVCDRPSRKRGEMSTKDQKIIDERNAEQARIENIVPYRNKQRVLIFCSRGVTSRFRHLMEDMRSLLPHHRREHKHDNKKNLVEINELADVKGCNNCLYFEARKSKDLYMWMGKCPNGPSVKFHVLNIHTMDELRLSGNCLKGSRPYLSFSSEFDLSPEYELVKELFVQIYGTPNGHPKSKPFVDHIMNFSILDGKIWFRHFQIVDSTQDPKEILKALKSGEETIQLVEIGPRFVMNIIKIFEGSFSGRSLYENADYITPNAQRSAISKAKGHEYKNRKISEQKRDARLEINVLPSDPLREMFK